MGLNINVAGFSGYTTPEFTINIGSCHWEQTGSWYFRCCLGGVISVGGRCGLGNSEMASGRSNPSDFSAILKFSRFGGK